MTMKVNLEKAKTKKNDEFYTQLADIEKELVHYREHFKDKVVYCNADDPRVSNFFHYFSYNFELLGLKKLITTCYKNQEIDLFSMHDKESAIALVYEGEKDNGNVPTIENIGVIELKGDGDFRSPESIEFLKEADIVVTNPPFSLFREYISQLVEYEKKFLIVGNINALTYKETFSLIKKNKMWLGYNTTRHFLQPDGTLYETARTYWYTNLDIAKRNEDMILYKKYNKEDYPNYENYDGINVDTTADIPKDYSGVMGVPITFLAKYSPSQFEIVELGITGSCEFINNRKMEILDRKGKPTGKMTQNAKGTLYRKYNSLKDTKAPAFKDADNGTLYSSIFARILIKNRKVEQ